MRKISKRIISFILTLVMILTTGMSGIATESAKAADSENVLSFTYRYGNSTQIQVDTNLPESIKRKDFLAGDNECELTQKGTQSFGYVWMPQETEKILLAFVFNKSFEEGQTYGLSKGDIFGFKDANDNIVKYTLDADYTFTYKGDDGWSVEREENPVRDTVTIDGKTYTVKNRNKLQTGYATEGLVQFKNVCDFKVPKDNTNLNFKGTVMLDGELVENPNFQGYAGDTTIVLNVGHGDKLLTIYEGSIIYYGELAFVVSETFNARFENGAWTAVADIPEKRYPSFDMTFRYGTNKLIQVNTNLPVEAIREDFLASAEGFDLQDDKNEYHRLGYAHMSNEAGTVVLTFYFNDVVGNGQNYKLPKGAKFALGDGTYELDTAYTFWFDGNGWFVVTEKDGKTQVTVDGQTMEVVKSVDLNKNPSIAYNNETLIQFGGMADLGASDASAGTEHTFRGTIYVNGVKVNNVQARGYQGIDMITLSNLHNYYNKVVTIMPGSLICYEGKAILINKAFHAKYTESDTTEPWSKASWLGAFPVVSGDTNNNGLVDSVDLVYLKKQEGQNTNALTDLIADGKIDTLDLNSMRSILVGVTTWDQIKEALLAESNFNGGGEYITFADRPADPTNPEKIEEYKAAGFNTATVTGEYTMHETAHPTEYYVLMTTEEAEVDKSGKVPLTLKCKSYESVQNGQDKDGKPQYNVYIQLETNIPKLQNNSGYDFTVPTDKHTIWMEQSEGAQPVGWHGINYDATTDKVYWVLHYNDLFKYQDTYTLKAGTTLNIDGTAYILDKTYKFQYTNDYRVSIDNLDKAGLNVWIRNASNKKDYFTTDIMDLLELYKDVIDGVYAGDEPFTTAEVKEASNKYVGTEDLMTFADIKEMLPTLNTYFADKYFFINQVGIYGYNHYEEAPKATPTLSAYATFFDSYNKEVLNNVESNKTPLCFDLYPLGYDTRTTKYKNFGSGLNLDIKQTWSVDKWKETGISPYYLITMLTVANKAKEQGNIFSYYIQAKNNVSETDEHPVRQLDSEKKASKNEISMQLYAGMACGATMYGYYLYNALPTGSESGMIDAQGNQTLLYGYVQSANKEALPFADVLKTFTWEGAEFFAGTETNYNSEAKEIVDNSSMNLMLDNTTDGVLTSASATDDILVGYYKKDGQDAYMIANYNDPQQVKIDNTVTLNFGDCNCARVYYGTENGLTSKIVELKDGTFEWTLKPGGGCFVIPVKAAS